MSGKEKHAVEDEEDDDTYVGGFEEARQQLLTRKHTHIHTRTHHDGGPNHSPIRDRRMMTRRRTSTMRTTIQRSRSLTTRMTTRRAR